MTEENIRNYDAYLFDWDGTLGRTLESWLRILRGQSQAYGLKATDAEIASYFGRWDWALEFGLDPAKLDAFIAGVREQAMEQNPLVPLYDNGLRVLQALRARGKKLALITATPREIMEIAVHHHKVAELFDAIIAGDEVKQHKPHPEGIGLALEALGSTKDQALMLGDSDKDLLAAKNAGVDSLLFYPPSHRVFYDRAYLDSIGPRFTIGAWKELLNQLQ